MSETRSRSDFGNGDAAKLLRKGEAFSSAVFETTRTPLVVLSKGFEVAAANRAFYDLFKTTPERTEGQSLFHLGERKWDIPSLRALLKEILPKHTSFNDYEVAGHFPGLGRRTMVLNARQLAGGGEAQILLAIEDVTAARQAQGALEASELRFRRIFECFQEGIIIIDPVSRQILEANGFVLDILGRTREEVRGKELWQLRLLASEQASHGWFRQLQSTGRVRVSNIRVTDRNGAERRLVVAGSLYDEGGYQRILCEVHDITESQRTLEGKMLLAAIVESSDDSIISIRLDGTIASWNAAAQRLYGYSAKEIVGKPLTTLTLAKDLKEVLARIKRIGEGKEVDMFETYRVHKDGQPIHLSIKLSAVKDENGRIVGVSTHARDVSEEKRLNLELQQSYVLLEKRVQERTSELKKSEELLRALSERLVDSQEDEAHRIGMELHDSIGGALTALKLQITRAASRQFEEGKEELTEAVSGILQEMRQICRRLHPSVLRDFGVKEGLRAYITDFQERTGIKVQYRWSDAVERSLGAREQVSLYRVMQESLTNVAKHSGCSEVQVAFGSNDRSVWLEVNDYGTGFSASSSERQSHGLSGMLDRMAMLGGRFDITSTPGSGTRVFASFPRGRQMKKVAKSGISSARGAARKKIRQ